MRVHINEIKGNKIGYKIRWTEDGKPKEAFRKGYKDAAALQASVRERIIRDHYLGFWTEAQAEKFWSVTSYT